MITSRPNKFFCLPLAVLLLLPAVPVNGESADNVRLDLERAFVLQGAIFQLGHVENGGEDLRSLATLAPRRADHSLSSGYNVSAIDASSAVVRPAESDLEEPLLGFQETPAMIEIAREAHLERKVRGDGGFGRWLKKYWYVPVLASAALVTVADDDSDGMDSDY